MNLSEWWNQLDPPTREAVVRILLAALVLVLVWALRFGLARLIVAPVRRLAQRSNATWDEVLLDAIILPARLLIIALGLAVGAQILQVDPAAGQFVDHLVRTLVIIALLLAAYRAVDALAPSSVGLFRITGLTVTERLLPFFRTAIKLVLLAIALVIVIQEWGYDVSGLVAGLGLGGLAFSLAAKDTVENLFGFTMIVSDQPFVVGEYIKTPDVEGTVEYVGVRSTRVRQPDQAYVTVPNSKLASSVILNWSRLSKRWYDQKLLIAYSARRQAVEAMMQQARDMLKGREKVDPNSVLVRFINFGPEGLEILIRGYVLLSDWGQFTAEKESINLELLKIIEENGLRIALPARSMYIVESAPGVLDGGQSSASTD
jgi:MscS family membrane protein